MGSALLRAAAVLLATHVFVGCDDGTGPIPAELVGLYTLESVDGKSLPAPLGPPTGQSLTATQGNLAIESDGEYRQLIRTRFVSATGVEDEGTNATQGRFSVRGTEIELRETLGKARTGSFQEGIVRYSITVGGRPVALVWRK